MAWESVPPALQLCLKCKCVGPRRHPLPRYDFFFFFHCSSLSSCYHSTGTISTAYARGMTATLSGGMQTTTPLLPLSLSPPHPLLPLPALVGTQVKLCFFSSFFHFFSDHWRDLFSPHAGSSNPHLSTMPCPSSLTSLTTAIASFTGM